MKICVFSPIFYVVFKLIVFLYRPYRVYKLFDSHARFQQDNRMISVSAFKSYIFSGIAFFLQVHVFRRENTIKFRDVTQRYLGNPLHDTP